MRSSIHDSEFPSSVDILLNAPLPKPTSFYSPPLPLFSFSWINSVKSSPPARKPSRPERSLSRAPYILWEYILRLEKSRRTRNGRGKLIVCNHCSTFVCPTEIIAFSDRVEEFRSINAEVIACSVDSAYTHLAWTKTPREKGGLENIKIPLLSDLTHQISKVSDHQIIFSWRIIPRFRTRFRLFSVTLDYNQEGSYLDSDWFCEISRRFPKGIFECRDMSQASPWYVI